MRTQRSFEQTSSLLFKSTAEYWDGGTAGRPGTDPQTPPPPALPVRNTLASVVAALQSHPAWAGVLATHLGDTRVVFRKAPPFAPSVEVAGDPVAVRDRDMDRIRHWFETVLSVRLSKADVVDAVRFVADEHAFHPVREYLAGLAWDGQPRVCRWLENYAGVRPSGGAEAALVGNVGVTMRVSRILARLGYERRRRPTLPRAYHYVRVDVPPSHRPSTPEQTSNVPPTAPRSHR